MSWLVLSRPIDQEPLMGIRDPEELSSRAPGVTIEDIQSAYAKAKGLTSEEALRVTKTDLSSAFMAFLVAAFEWLDEVDSPEFAVLDEDDVLRLSIGSTRLLIDRAGNGPGDFFPPADAIFFINELKLLEVLGYTLVQGPDFSQVRCEDDLDE